MTEPQTLREKIARLLTRWLTGSDAERETPAVDLADAIIALVVGEMAKPVPRTDDEAAEEAINEYDAEIARRFAAELPNRIANERVRMIERRAKKTRRRLKVCEANGSRLLDLVQDLAGRVRDHEDRIGACNAAASILGAGLEDQSTRINDLRKAVVMITRGGDDLETVRSILNDGAISDECGALQETDGGMP